MTIPMLRRGALAFAAGLLAACGASSETVPTAGAEPAASAAADCLQTLGSIDVQRSTIPQIQSALRSGALSSVALVNLYLQRIATFDTSGAQLNAVRMLAPNALAQTFIDSEIDRNQLDAIIAPDGNNIGVTAAAGYPDLTVPMGYTGQVPHGLSFAGKAFTEARLLALAYAYEQATKLRQPATLLNPQLAAFCPKQ